MGIGRGKWGIGKGEVWPHGKHHGWMRLRVLSRQRVYTRVRGLVSCLADAKRERVQDQRGRDSRAAF